MERCSPFPAAIKATAACTSGDSFFFFDELQLKLTGPLPFTGPLPPGSDSRLTAPEFVLSPSVSANKASNVASWSVIRILSRVVYWDARKNFSSAI